MSQDIFKPTIPEPPAVYPAPGKPPAVYHPPEQEKPCCKCVTYTWDNSCRHGPPPDGLARGFEPKVNPFGTCDYWESNND